MFTHDDNLFPVEKPDTFDGEYEVGFYPEWDGGLEDASSAPGCRYCDKVKPLDDGACFGCRVQRARILGLPLPGDYSPVTPS